jgi:hypothetical protein
MSDQGQQFPMPKTVDVKPVSEYAKRPAELRGLDAVANEIERGHATAYPRSSYVPQPGSQHISTIRDSIKKLTHREMREMVEMIFKAHKTESKATESDGILRADMADVLDAFAYGE